MTFSSAIRKKNENYADLRTPRRTDRPDWADYFVACSDDNEHTPVETFKWN